MTKPYQLPHSDDHFVKSFIRYMADELVFSSKDFDDLVTKLKSREKYLSQILFDEFRFQCLFHRIEMVMIDGVFSSLLSKGIIKPKIYEYFIRKIKYYNKLNIEEATQVFKDEFDNKMERAITPHGYFVVAGMGAGEMIEILNDFMSGDKTKYIELKKNMKDLNDFRNIIIHQRDSSRRDIESVLIEANKLANITFELIKTLSK